MAISRRNFIAALPLPFLMGPAFAATKREKVDVVVIGAGLAGLNAAVNLEDLGASVMVLEAAPVVGGRLRTIRTETRSYECGATTIGPEYGRIRSLADRYDVPLVSPLKRGGMAFGVNDQLVSAADWATSEANRTQDWERTVTPAQLESVTMARFGKLAAPDDWRLPSEFKWDVPLDEFYRQIGLSEEAIRLIEITSNVETLKTTSALFQMKELQSLVSWGSAGGQKNSVYESGSTGFDYIGGGSDQLPKAIAANLKSVRTSMPVVEIDMNRKGCKVRTQDGTVIECQYVISAIPFTALKNIRISPRPAGLRAESINDSLYMGTTHIFFEVTKPYWEADGVDPGMITDGVVERVFANKGASGEVEWINVWMNGKPALDLDQRSEADAVAYIESELYRVRPSMRGALKFGGFYSWSANPYVTGNKHIFQPGQIARFGQQIAEPWQRLHFAGEHTRDVEPGMEAAAATGERAAFEILERMGKA